MYAQTEQQVLNKQDTIARFSTIDTLFSKTIPAGGDTISEINEPDTLDSELRISPSAIKSTVTYTANDSIFYDVANQEVHLFGKAHVTYEDIQIESEYIKIDLKKTLVHATGLPDSVGVIYGTPVFKQGDTEYKINRLVYNYKSKRGYLSELKTKEGEGYIKGQDVIRNAQNEFGIRNSYYTTCELDTPHFFINAKRLKVIPDKKIVTGTANLRIENIPTPLVIPFGIFSIKRGQSSGIVIPTYGSSINRGFFLRGGGYYFGLGEKADYLITGDIFTQGSWALNNLLRYNNRYRYGGQLSFNYNYNKFGSIEDPTYNLSKDFRLHWTHNVDPKATPNSRFSADVNYASQNALANNSYVPQNVVTSQILSSVNYSKSFGAGKYNLITNAGMSQNLQTGQISMTLPSVVFNVSSFSPFKSKNSPVASKWYENITLNYSTNFRNVINSYDTILFQNRNNSELKKFYDTAAQYGIQHNIPIQTSFKILKYYTLSAGVQISEYWYLNSIEKQFTNNQLITTQKDGFVRAATFQPRVGLTTRYFGLKKFSGNTFKAIRHVVTPTVDFTYIPDYSTNNWGYYKSYTDNSGVQYQYSIFERGIFGGPSKGKQGNIGFKLDNNLEIKVMRGKDTARKETKIQLFESFYVATNYNIFADSLNLSPLAVSARTKLFKSITANGSFAIDPYQNIVTNKNGYKYVTRINQLYLQQNQLGLLTYGNIGVSASLNPDMFKKQHSKSETKYPNEWKYVTDRPEDYYDFNIPWNLSFNYYVQFNHYNNLNNPLASKFIQTLSFSGDLNLTKNWKIAGSSGYDIDNKQLTYTSIDIVRDLHCWTFKLTWIPIGFRQSFFFQLNVRSSVLQDLKLTRRREWYDKRL